jgi:hypothetical protein
VGHGAEDYSPDGDAWTSLPHDHARSRAYRWGEDGLAGFCGVEQRLCLGLALWNGRDPILTERLYGLTGAEDNHGEDAKDYWWFLDALPSHAWNRWRYHYPQADLIERPQRHICDHVRCRMTAAGRSVETTSGAPRAGLLTRSDIAKGGRAPRIARLLRPGWFEEHERR